ncbi:MAG: glucosidase [Verrucomicrobiae bacterium]|nr:glucosidase [Verrucomicrobiae bacterium]
MRPSGPEGPDAGNAEYARLEAARHREADWSRWGPFLPERQWATVREDYSANGDVWHYLPHDHARSRAYRWGEDGLLGWCDRQCRVCFAVALWNGRDPILKERLFGLTGPEGNHGEDVKEEYYYLDATPTSSYARALYKYPQAPFPYEALVSENRRRNRHQPEYELADTGAFAGGRYFDVIIEYAKAAPEDVLIRVEVWNRGPEAAPLDVLPTVWFRNNWSWGCPREGVERKPSIARVAPDRLQLEQEAIGRLHFLFVPPEDDGRPGVLFTENATNRERLFAVANEVPWVKDAFHEYVVDGVMSAVNPEARGTKAAPHYRRVLDAGGSCVFRFRLSVGTEPPVTALPAEAPAFDAVVAQRRSECDAFYRTLCPGHLGPEECRILRQAYAGLLWSRQFYHFAVEQWLDGDPGQPAPPASRQSGRNRDWRHLYARDVLSMPDKWEYPWFAAWDLAFHMLPLAHVDPDHAKDQLQTLLREWYLHPNGQLPAYEFALGDVNPPVHPWAAWRVYKVSAPKGGRDREFLEGVFQKLLLNFTWWVNRKDANGQNLFSGGFLGLDNIGVFDRSHPLPQGGTLQQADATAWMAFYCSTMLAIALELAWDGHRVRTAYEDMASKFLEHFVQIAEAMNVLGGTGLWDEVDGFYYDEIRMNGTPQLLKTRSLVGLMPLIAVEVFDRDQIERLPGFTRRLKWFIEHRLDHNRGIALGYSQSRQKLLLSIPTRDRLRRVLRYLGDEGEFLSPFGIRSLSRYHEQHPYRLTLDGVEHRVDYTPGESDTALFGGNSNWRGPVWFPVNYLIIEALERYHHFYGPEFTFEYPAGSGRQQTLAGAAADLERRLISLFLPDANGRRPCHGEDARYATDPHWRDLLLFHEYFHADTGRGCGASHQTGWTALVLRFLEDRALGPRG